MSLRTGILAALAAAANAEVISLGFSRKYSGVKETIVVNTVEITQADIDFTASSDPKIFIEGSRSLAPSFTVFLKKGADPTSADTDKFEIANGSATGYASGEFAIAGPGTYHIGVLAACPLGVCSGVSTTIAPYLKTGATITGTNPNGLKTGDMAPFQIKKGMGQTAYYHGLGAVNLVGAPAAVIVLDAPEKLFFDANTHTVGAFKIISKKGMIPTATANDKSFPSSSPVPADWTDSADFEAGTWYFAGKIDDYKNLPVDFTFGIGIGEPPTSAANTFGPTLALMGAFALVAALF